MFSFQLHNYLLSSLAKKFILYKPLICDVNKMCVLSGKFDQITFFIIIKNIA